MPRIWKPKPFDCMTNKVTLGLIAAGALILGATHVFALDAGTVFERPQPPLEEQLGSIRSHNFEVAQACGHYIILGCFKSRSAARARLRSLGGSMVGGGAGTYVVNTDDYPNFRDGWYCVADGPYATRSEAESIAWKEAIPDAYVKSGC